jgi:CRISPR-associated endonuclease Csn1
MDKSKELFVGLDIGTDSVGWAATDQNYDLLRLKGKTAWGARLFDEANSAKDRRMFRTARRRLARRAERVRLLNTLFDPLIKEVDPTFLLRLSYSMLQNDDEKKPKEARSDALLFGSKEAEKAFYKKWPTIWHLRKALIEGDDEAYSDIRYIYLAVHHIIKYRGNFLRSGIEVNNFEKAADEAFRDVNAFFAEKAAESEDADDTESFVALPEANFKTAADAILGKNEEWVGKRPSKSDKKRKILSLFDKAHLSERGLWPFAEMFVSLSVGLPYNTKKLGEDGEYGEENIVFDNSYEENEDKYINALGDASRLLNDAKAVYDAFTLNDILGKESWLSFAFAGIYDAHKEELKALKALAKDVDAKHGLKDDDSIYFRLFKKKDSEKNYAAFVHVGSEKKRPSLHDFDAYVISLFKPYDEELASNKAYQQLKVLAENDQLLATVAVRSTSVIPEQLHRKELLAILDGAVKHGVNGISEIKDKVIAIFDYKIPYYCGPLTSNSPYSNAVRKEGDTAPFYPWDWKEHFDLEATKEKFMKGLTNKCTYLPDCDVLPASSILYQDFDTFNKLNDLKLNGIPLTHSEKEDLVKNLIFRRDSTSMSQIRSYLAKSKGAKTNDVQIEGWDKDEKTNCSSRHALADAFGLAYDEDRSSSTYKLVEDIITLKTIFVDSASDAEQAIKKAHPNLSDEQWKAVRKLSCKGWGRLSKEFLTLPTVDKKQDDGTIHYLIDLLRENGDGKNLNQLLYDDRYDFQEAIKRHHESYFPDDTPKQAVYRLIETISPKMRRPIIQSIRIIQEVTKAAGKTPSVISIEVTRSNDPKRKGQRTKSRKDVIADFLKALKGQDKERSAQLAKELNGIDEAKLRGKHLYLYFMQNGRDAYTGEPIDINDVINSTKYDTDHIIPQSKIKDDSLDNLVLVRRETNQRKSDEYPLPAEIRSKKEVVMLWKRLHDARMMSDKKFNNLMRAAPLSDTELQQFVAAQINVVNQSTVVLRDCLDILYRDDEKKPIVIFSKAQYPSLIRKELMIPKLRDLNDTHHAVDAYLNIVAGHLLYKKFNNLRLIKAVGKDEGARMSLNMDRYLEYCLFKDGGQTPTDLARKIDAISRRHDFLLTYRLKYNDGAFYDQTVYGSNSGKFKPDVLLPVKSGLDKFRYGGYTNASIETNFVATIKNKKGEKRYLLGVTHLDCERLRAGQDRKSIIEKLVTQVPHGKNDLVMIDMDNPIPFGIKIKRKGLAMLLSPRNSLQVALQSATPIFLSRSSELFLDSLRRALDKDMEPFHNSCDVVSVVTNKDGGKITWTNQQAVSVLNELIEIASRPIFAGYPILNELRDSSVDHENQISTTDALRNEMTNSDFVKKYEMLFRLINLFSRNVDGRSPLKKPKAKSSDQNTTKEKPKMPYRPSRGTILESGWTIVYESVTGLYSTRPGKEKKL